MASITLYVDEKKARVAGSAKVYFLVRLDRTVRRYVPLDISITAADFDFKKMRCKPSHTEAAAKNLKLREKEVVADKIILDLADQEMSIDELVDHLKSKLKHGGRPILFKTIRDEYIHKLRLEKREGNARNLELKTNLFLEWMGGEPTLKNVTAAKLSDWKTYLIARDKSVNTIYGYLAAVLRIPSYAINIGLFPKDLYPNHRGLMPTSTPGENKDLTISEIEELEKIRPTLKKRFRKAVDMTLLQFYFQGCDICDLARFKKERIKDGRYKFKRYKMRNRSNQPEINVLIIDKAWTIINEYPDSEYLVPLFDDIFSNPFLQPEEGDDKEVIEYKGKEVTVALYKQNQIERRYYSRISSILYILKAISEKINCSQEITTKTMRDTWATQAEMLGINSNIAWRAQGHKIKGSHETYVNANRPEILRQVDDANAKICALGATPDPAPPALPPLRIPLQVGSLLRSVSNTQDPAGSG